MPFCAYCGSQVAETSYRLCPSCGNPTNGAPRPVLSTGGTSAGIIAIVLGLLAIPMLGILAAIAIPNFLTAVQRSKQKRTMADIREVAQKLEQQAATSGAYPVSLEQRWPDGWNTDLRYECLANEDKPCTGYALTSAGKDRQFEHRSAAEYPEGATRKFDCDIVFANGSFVQYPEGASR